MSAKGKEDSFRLPSETQVLKNYFEVPEEVLEDAEELTAWAREAAARKGKRKAPAVPSGR